MFNSKKTPLKYIKASMLLTLALFSVPSAAKADDFGFRLGVGSTSFYVGEHPDWQQQAWREHQWREHQWREQAWREHQWREHQWHERERARYFESRYPY